MLNRVILMGRITHDLEIKTTQSGTPVLRFMVAVDRYSKTEDKQADFITCAAFGQRAEFISRYFSKGRMIALEGNLKTGSYDGKNGVKHYTTDVWVDNVSFTGERAENTQSSGSQPQNTNSPGTSADHDDLEVLSDNGVPF